MIAGQLPTIRSILSPGVRPGDHPQQRDPGQPRQRRRRRDPVPDGRQLPDQRLQQHHREQRVDPRGRRRRARRRAQRPVLQQHDHEERHDGHGRDEQRPAGPGRPVDGRQQRAAPGARCPAGSPLYSNPLLFNNIFWDNRAGQPRPAATSLGIGQPGDADALNNWDMGVSATAGLLAPDQLDRPAERRHPPVHDERRPTTSTDPQVASAYDTVLDFAPWRTTRTSWARSWSRRTSRRGSWATTTSRTPRVAGVSTWARRARPSRPTSSRRRSLAGPPIDIDDQARPSSRRRSTAAPTRTPRRSAEPLDHQDRRVRHASPRAGPPRTRSSCANAGPSTVDRRGRDRHLPGLARPSPPGRAPPRPARAARPADPATTGRARSRCSAAAARPSRPSPPSPRRRRAA